MQRIISATGSLPVAIAALNLLMALAAACGSTHYSPDATATLKAPALLPINTPQLATGLRTVELDPELRVLYVVGQEYAAIGLDNQVHLVDVNSGQINRITDDAHPKYRAAFSTDYVAWTDHRRRIELRDVDSHPPFNYSDDIFVLDRATGEQKRITEDPARRRGLEISGDWLVWLDRRNETGQHYVNFDIYAYNLRTGKEIPVAVAPGSQRSVAIHGSTVVWADNRNSPLAEAENGELPDPGCGDCPENRFDIYALDLTTGERRVLVETGYYNAAPEINGAYLAWRSYDPQRLPEIRLLDLESSHTRTLAQEGNFWSGPLLSDEYMVWSTSWPCDVGTGEGHDFTGVFAQRLGTGEIWKLSDYVEPTATVSGSMVIITERCQVGGREYAVFLK